MSDVLANRGCAGTTWDKPGNALLMPCNRPRIFWECPCTPDVVWSTMCLYMCLCLGFASYEQLFCVECARVMSPWRPCIHVLTIVCPPSCRRPRPTPTQKLLDFLDGTRLSAPASVILSVDHCFRGTHWDVLMSIHTPIHTLIHTWARTATSTALVW